MTIDDLVRYYWTGVRDTRAAVDGSVSSAAINTSSVLNSATNTVDAVGNVAMWTTIGLIAILAIGGLLVVAWFVRPLAG